MALVVCVKKQNHPGRASLQILNFNFRFTIFMFHPHTILAFCGIWISALVYAQEPLFSHQKWYRVEDGLPQSFVVDVHQDEQGFIWAATRDGLARFDGKAFKVWRSDPKDPRTLAGNVALEMFKLQNGRFILTFQGNAVDEFDPVTGKVRHLASDHATAKYFQKGRRFVFPKSNQWFYHEEMARGLGRIDIDHPEKNIFYNASNVLQHGDSIVGSFLHRDGRLWMVSPMGIYQVDSIGSKVDWFPFQDPQDMAKPYRVRAAEVFLAWEKWLVISALDALFFWNIQTRELKKIPLVPLSFSQYRFPSHFQVDSSGFLYFRQGTGVYRMDESLTSLSLVWENKLVPGRAITGCMVDRTGTLWVGIDAAGLVKVNLKTMPLTSMAYTGTFHQTVLQLQGFSPSSIPPRWLDARYGSYYFRYGYAPDKKLFLTYSFGTPIGDRQLFVAENRRMIPLPMPAGESETYFRGISFEPSGGIYAYNENRHELYYWRTRENFPLIKRIQGLDSLGSFDVADAKWIDGILWLSTYGAGLLKIKDEKVVAHFSEGNSGAFNMPANLTAINPDPSDKDILWMGSLGGGLIKMHREKGIMRIMTTEDGLPNNTVYCLENDSLGNIWLSTNNGLVRFTPSTGGMHVFYKSDGLPGNEFNRSHSMRLQDGRLAFGGPDGLVVFDPDDYEPPSGRFETRLTITGIEVNGKLLNEQTDSNLLKMPVSRLEAIELRYNQNFLGVSFAALLFNEPQNIKYRYRLLPDEKEWNESGNNSYARYTQLRPGKYTLEMNATGLDGNWSEEIKQLAIRVKPPIWRTWYAWILYVLVAAGLIRYFIRSRLRILRASQKLAYELREADRLRELDKMKEAFFANITHELRTPLTLIKVPLDELARDENLPAPARKTIETARRNSQSLLRLINQLLDINKLESGQMKVVENVGEPRLFVAQCLQPFESGALARKLEFQTNLLGMEGHWFFDADKWEKIIFNLLSNAIKFTPEGGKIQFDMEEMPDNNGSARVKISVTDTGIGMTEQELDKIFDRFFRSQTAEMHYSGTGIGLALVKEITRLLDGEIMVESNPGKGTKFTLILPARQAIGELEAKESGMGIGFQNDDAARVNKGTEPVVIPGISILLAEDNEDLRSFLQESLQEKYVVEVVSNGMDAWKRAKSTMPDILITDMMMPKMDGTELCQRVKEDLTTSHIPIIMLTSRAANEARLIGRGAGADVYLTKPFELEELKLCIRNLADMQERQRRRWQTGMLDQSSNIPGPADEFSSRLYEFVEENLDEPNLGVEQLAGKMGMSRSTLNRKLQTIIGLSANDFIRQYRLKKASSLLLSGFDVSQVAYRTGFSSPSYFTLRFREFFGKTPSEFISDRRLTQN